MMIGSLGSAVAATGQVPRSPRFESPVIAVDVRASGLVNEAKLDSVIVAPVLSVKLLAWATQLGVVVGSTTASVVASMHTKNGCQLPLMLQPAPVGSVH